MAWQLVYTSAPRLLDAGRSGFGTVARHRAIPQLLLQAVERFSQFARLPGTDPDRIIYSHRMVVLSAARYHILSMIRSAGSDYTGRTNHIAHHLLAAEREAAECAAAGITPADVLLGHGWLSAWQDQPLWLEEHQEVRLAALPPFDMPCSAWAALTGNPAHAWLLVTHPASRNCLLGAPVGTDFRLLFLESLRGMRLASWQPTFTTSLEPTDEPTDLRWIGCAGALPGPDSPEGTGRVILNLAEPETLPEPEAPRQFIPPPNVATLPTQVPRSSLDHATPFVEEDDASTARSSLPRPSLEPMVPAHRPASDLPASPWTEPKASDRSRKPLSRQSLVVAIFVAAGILLFAGFHLWQEHGEDEKRRQDVILWLGREGSESYRYYEPSVDLFLHEIHDDRDRRRYCFYAQELFDVIALKHDLDRLNGLSGPTGISTKISFPPVETLDCKVRVPLLDLKHGIENLRYDWPVDIAVLKKAVGLQHRCDDFERTLPEVLQREPLQDGIRALIAQLSQLLNQKLEHIAKVIKSDYQAYAPEDISKIAAGVKECNLENVASWKSNRAVQEIINLVKNRHQDFPALAEHTSPTVPANVVQQSGMRDEKNRAAPLQPVIQGYSPLHDTAKKRLVKGKTTIYIVEDLKTLQIPVPAEFDLRIIELANRKMTVLKPLKVDNHAYATTAGGSTVNALFSLANGSNRLSANTSNKGLFTDVLELQVTSAGDGAILARAFLVSPPHSSPSEPLVNDVFEFNLSADGSISGELPAVFPELGSGRFAVKLPKDIAEQLVKVGFPTDMVNFAHDRLETKTLSDKLASRHASLQTRRNEMQARNEKLDKDYNVDVKKAKAKEEEQRRKKEHVDVLPSQKPVHEDLNRIDEMIDTLSQLLQEPLLGGKRSITKSESSIAIYYLFNDGSQFSQMICTAKMDPP